MGATSAQQERITRDDLAAKLRELEGGAREQAESARGTIVAAGVVGIVVLLLVAFLLGRRAGKQRSTIVEIRRV
ncbi:MAG: hypothetical protein ACLFXM_06565 [Acidimicrobiia bacterium]